MLLFVVLEEIMEKRILAYRKRIDELLAKYGIEDNKDWDGILKEHLTQIAFFQHERLIHLIVTVTFAILTFMGLAVYIISEFVPMLALIALLMVLLVPYIRHYYILENEVQKMYWQYDKMLEIIRKTGDVR